MENHKKLAHLLDVTQCVGCSACIVACAQTNYPDMLNAENTGWESLPAKIPPALRPARHRPVHSAISTILQALFLSVCSTVAPNV